MTGFNMPFAQYYRAMLDALSLSAVAELLVLYTKGGFQGPHFTCHLTNDCHLP